MADVGGSSVTRSSADQTVREFDVAREHDILGLLQFVRRGPFDDTRKTELRDAILDFATSRKEETLKSIAEHTKVAGVVLYNNGTTVLEESVVETQVSRIGASRPQPTFDISRATTSTPRQTDQGTDSVSRAKTSEAEEIAHQDGAQKHHPTETPRSSNDPKPTKKIAVKSNEATAAPTTSGAPDAQPARAQEHPVKSAPAPETEAAPADEPVEVQHAPPASETPVAPTKTQQTHVHTQSTPSAPEPVSQTSSKETATTSSSPPDIKATDRDALQRIKEIKQAINRKVGNPVNLIDANNTIGREYMNALLNAMRVVSGSNTEETSLAMDRLEKAFTTVNESIDAGETVIGEKKKEPAPAPAKEVQTQEASAAAATPAQESTQQQNAPAPEQPKAQSTPQPPTPPTEPAQAPAPNASTLAAAPTPPASTQPPPQPAPPKQPTAPAQPTAHTPQPASQTQTQTQNSAKDAQLPGTQQQNAPASNQSTQPVQPKSIAEKLAEENAARERLLAQRASERQREEESEEHSGDPLYTNEISSGLQQLLSEWKLFKGSGIFGTGPSGYEHPLYKQLSSMTMAAIIAGRFEGATPEAKQSIADYMNGWRYEQGVVHEMNETFEHYLRRVVKEILEKQKGPKA